ncbi:sensor histidine kinase [Cryobacterium lactosi]|nr:histidine kinase [Cryobacterium lactosi]
MSTASPSIRPLRRSAALWGTLWRMALALSTGLIAMLFSYGPALEATDPTAPESLALGGRLVLDVVLGLVAVGLIPLRRRAPLAVLLGIIAVAAVSATATGAAALVLVSLSTRRRWPETAAATVLFVAATVLFDLLLPVRDSVATWQLVLVAAALSSILPITGMYIGGRRELLATLREQADSARREQQAKRDQAQSAERARIAREMHDVLAHRLSLVALHAGVLESRPDLPEAQRAATVTIVRENAHRALSELRDVLGVLHDPDTTGQQRTQPQPTLADLPALFEESRLAGTPAVLQIDDAVAKQLDTLDSATSRHLYRFVQEGLTNARKHAPGQTVVVHLGGAPGTRVTLRLDNTVVPGSPAPGGQPRSGMGLGGLRERARLAGGELSVDTAGPGRFTVAAWLPWTQ